MNDRKVTTAKVLILIPLVIFVATIVAGVAASLLEFPTDRGGLYSVLALIAILNLFTAPLPCLILSIIGTVKIVKARQQDVTDTAVFLFLGVAEIIASIIFTILAAGLFIVGQSV